MARSTPVRLPRIRQRAHRAAATLLVLVAVGLPVASPRAQGSSAPAVTEPPGGPGRRVLVFGGDRDFYPYEWLDEGGTAHGFNVDLVAALGELLGADIRFELDRWDRIRHGIEVDRRIHMSDMYYSETRAKVVEFAEPFSVVWEQAWVRTDGPEVSGLEDLRGLRVLVNRAGYIHEFLQGWDPEITLIPVDSERMALRELADGHGDCALVTQLLGRVVTEREDLAGLRPSGPPMLPRSYGLVVRKGDTALLADVNRGMAALRSSGRMKELEDRWLASPASPGRLALFVERNLSVLLLALSALLAAGLGVTLILSRKVGRQARAIQAELDERRRAEEALRQSREQFRLAFQNSPSILAISDLESGVYLEVNRAFETILGWSPEEAVGRTSFELNLWVAPGEWERLRRELDQHGTVRDVEVPLRTRQGDIRSLLLVADQIRLQGRPCMIISAVDISERKQWELALRDSEERWKFALEGAGDGVWDWDVASNRVYASRQYKEILGYPDDAFEYDVLPWNVRVHPEDVGRVEQDYIAYVRGRAPLFQTEVRMSCRDESFRWVSVRGRAVDRDERGRPLRVIGTITDVTERRRASEERKSLEDQLRQAQKMEVVGQLAGGIAHDFNNQLMVIRGYCDLLEAQGLGDRAQALLAEVIRASDRAAALTSRLLAFGRKQVRRLTVFNPNRVLADMTGALAMMVGDSISITIEAAPNLGNVRADRDQMEQVIANIAVNARDAMPGGGRLTIRTRNIVLDEEYARRHVGSKAGPHILLSFQDSGVGMDEATAARIFEPFFTTKQEGLGSGLGLSIVYGILKQSGGHVTVESEPGRGSTFKAFLPRVDEAMVDDRPVAAVPASRAPSATVLFVEDDPNLFSLLRGILDHAGYKVIAAPVPEQALLLADAHEGTIDLLVTDVVMPGISGPIVAERLMAKRPGIRILFLSGYPKDVLERQTVLPPGVRLLGKPFSPRDLLATIQKVLDSPPPVGPEPPPAEPDYPTGP